MSGMMPQERVVMIGTASKGIIDRPFQHNAQVSVILPNYHHHRLYRYIANCTHRIRLQAKLTKTYKSI